MIQPTELVERIWERDPTVWTGRDEAQWLGWLDEPLRMRQRIGELAEVAEASAEVEDVVLLGMGGSSLAPEVLRRAFGGLGTTERRYLLENVLAVRRIGDKARAAQAVLLEKDKEKLAAMSGDLAKAMDDLDDLL